MKSDGELMEILNAYDLTGSYRAAAELCGCSHHTVKKAVEDRAAGLPPAARRARMIDDWRDILEGWVVDSKGKIRGDKAHEKLLALGYAGTDRTTRRAVAEIKAQWRLGNTRVHRPWITEPGLWLQYDFADGPLVAGRKIVLLVAWLAWSRYRVVIALRDRTAPSVFAGLDRIFRLTGGAPTYLLTDNEKAVVENVAVSQGGALRESRCARSILDIDWVRIGQTGGDRVEHCVLGLIGCQVVPVQAPDDHDMFEVGAAGPHVTEHGHVVGRLEAPCGEHHCDSRLVEHEFKFMFPVGRVDCDKYGADLGGRVLRNSPFWGVR